MWVTQLLFNKNAGTVDNNCFYALCNCMQVLYISMYDQIAIVGQLYPHLTTLVSN